MDVSSHSLATARHPHLRSTGRTPTRPTVLAPRPASARATVTLALGAYGLLDAVERLGGPWAGMVQTLLLALRAVRAGRGGHFHVQVRVPAGAAGRVRVAATLRGSTARTTFRRRQPKPGKGTPATPASPATPATPATPTDTTSGAWWRPAVDATWQIQLSGRLDTSIDAQVYDIDGVDAPAATVAALRAAGRRTVCYFSAGSYEDWRPDAKSFPTAVLGSSNGWPGERWLDIRRLDVLGPILAARMDACKAKGFDAVDPDNVDGYANKTGFPLTAADQLAFNRWLADAAHARGLGVGLKNDLDQASALVASFDFAVNEQCVQYRECDALTPFVRTGKPVFGIEYSGTAATVCAEAQRLGLRIVRKALALDAPRTTCW